MNLTISSGVRAKLSAKIPPVSESEILQCFANRQGKFLLDTRADNQTDPPTQWFLSETDFGRKLKVVFMLKDNSVVIKSAYDPNAEEARIYSKYG